MVSKQTQSARDGSAGQAGWTQWKQCDDEPDSKLVDFRQNQKLQFSVHPKIIFYLLCLI